MGATLYIRNDTMSKSQIAAAVQTVVMAFTQTLRGKEESFTIDESVDVPLAMAESIVQDRIEKLAYSFAANSFKNNGTSPYDDKGKFLDADSFMSFVSGSVYSARLATTDREQGGKLVYDLLVEKGNDVATAEAFQTKVSKITKDNIIADVNGNDEEAKRALENLRIVAKAAGAHPLTVYIDQAIEAAKTANVKDNKESLIASMDITSFS